MTTGFRDRHLSPRKQMLMLNSHDTNTDLPWTSAAPGRRSPVLGPPETAVTSKHAPASRLRRHDELAQKQHLETAPTSSSRVRGSEVRCGVATASESHEAETRTSARPRSSGGAGSTLPLTVGGTQSAVTGLRFLSPVAVPAPSGAVRHHLLPVLRISACKGSVCRWPHHEPKVS